MSICKSLWMSRVISRVFHISVCVPFFPIKSLHLWNWRLLSKLRHNQGAALMLFASDSRTTRCHTSVYQIVKLDNLDCGVRAYSIQMRFYKSDT